MNLPKKTILILASLLSMIVLASCENPSAEKMGRAIDRTAEKTGNVIDDATITAKIKTAIAREQGLGALQINVDTLNGAVMLTGTVDSQQNSSRAAELAKSVEGVKAVDNRLIIKSKAERLSPAPARLKPPQLV